MDVWSKLFFFTVGVLLTGIVLILGLGSHWSELKLYTVEFIWVVTCGIPFCIFLRKSRTI